MNTVTFIALAVVGVAFVFLWKNGQLLRFSQYVQETREELKKCSWPTVEELKGSTLVVLLSVILLGGFTVITDAVVKFVMKLIYG